MSTLERNSPREFGEALNAARTAAGVSQETLIDRLKISRRTLDAFERGEFGKLPSRTFARMFLRQIAEQIGEPPDAWMVPFEKAWERFLQGSQSVQVVAIEPRARRRFGPWVIGLVVVAVGVAGVLYLASRAQGPGERTAPPTPAALLPMLVPSPAPSPLVTPPPEATPTAAPDMLVVRTGAAPCWVQVRIAGQAMQSKLMAAHEVWELAADGKEVELVFGDAGAIEGIEYLGEARTQVGRSGEVVRLTLGRSAPVPAPTSP